MSLFGGFLYTNTLLYFLGINSSDFFDTSDYIASGADIIFPILLSVLFGMFFYFQGALDDLSRIIVAEQFDKKLKLGMFWPNVLAIFFGVDFFVNLIYFEKFAPILLFPLAMFSSIALFFNLFNIDKYIEKKFIFRSIFVSILGFLIILSINISETVYEVKNENYKSPYTVFFTEEYKEYSDHTFLLANSKYVFLINNKTQETVVIPKTGIKAIQTKSEP